MQSCEQCKLMYRGYICRDSRKSRQKMVKKHGKLLWK